MNVRKTQGWLAGGLLGLVVLGLLYVYVWPWAWSKFIAGQIAGEVAKKAGQVAEAEGRAARKEQELEKLSQSLVAAKANEHKALDRAKRAEATATKLQADLKVFETRKADAQILVAQVPEKELLPNIRRSLVRLCDRGSIPRPCRGTTAHP